MEQGKSSRVLGALADAYEQSAGGQNGGSGRDFLIDYEELLSLANSGSGEARVCAERDLEIADERGIIVIERYPQTGLPIRIRFARAAEDRLFEAIQRESPTGVRMAFAEQFEQAIAADVPAVWREGWAAFCRIAARNARSGRVVSGFSKSALRDNNEILQLLPRLLGWESETFRRLASSRLCGDSKRLDVLRPRIESALRAITGGRVGTLDDLGILENERTVLLHGPVTLSLPGGKVDFTGLRAPYRLDRRDVESGEVQTPATICLTVENLSLLYELARANTCAILASSGNLGGFAHGAIVCFLNALPGHVKIVHSGDTDPKGFEILHNLRSRISRGLDSVAMEFDGSVCGPALTGPDKRLIEKLLASEYLTAFEKSQLVLMSEAGHKGHFEQEGRPFPIVEGLRP